MVKLQFILINAHSWQWWHFNFFLLDLSPRKYFLKYGACNIWFRVYLDVKQQSNTFRVRVTDRKVGKCDNKFVLMIILRWRMGYCINQDNCKHFPGAIVGKVWTVLMLSNLLIDVINFSSKKFCSAQPK